MHVYVLTLAAYFLIWTLVIYWTHKAAHSFEWLWQFHQAHHEVEYNGELEFSWWNLVGWFNDWRSTLDQWITEVIPTGVFILIFPDAWPIAIFYYIDGFVLAEGLTDHNPRIDVPGLSMGRYHLLHHKNPNVNYDLYFRIWDRLFGTSAQDSVYITRAK